jgi:hypothetical protein
MMQLSLSSPPPRSHGLGHTGIFLDTASTTSMRRIGPPRSVAEAAHPFSSEDFSSMHDERIAKYLQKHPQMRFSQRSAFARHLRDSIQFTKELGRGGFGAVYACTLPVSIGGERTNTECVIKVPALMLSPTAGSDFGQLRRGGVAPGTRDVLLPADRCDPVVLQTVLRSFRSEIMNAEFFLEPASLRRIRFDIERAHHFNFPDPLSDRSRSEEEEALVGTPLLSLNASEYFEIMRDLHHMRIHPGEPPVRG